VDETEDDVGTKCVAGVAKAPDASGRSIVGDRIVIVGDIIRLSNGQ